MFKPKKNSFKCFYNNAFSILLLKYKKLNKKFKRKLRSLVGSELANSLELKTVFALLTRVAFHFAYLPDFSGTFEWYLNGVCFTVHDFSLIDTMSLDTSWEQVGAYFLFRYYDAQGTRVWFSPQFALRFAKFLKLRDLQETELVRTGGIKAGETNILNLITEAEGVLSQDDISRVLASDSFQNFKQSVINVGDAGFESYRPTNRLWWAEAYKDTVSNSNWVETPHARESVFKHIKQKSLESGVFVVPAIDN